MLRKLENELAQFNRAKIFIDSEDIDGKDIGFYSKATERITKGRKKAGQPFNLRETGKFLDGLFAEVRGENVIFGTTDGKKDEVLENLLTTEIFGLQDNDLTRAIDSRLLPLFLKFTREKIT